MLPGAMLHNEKLRFICKNVNIRVESVRSVFTGGLNKGDVLEVPVSHGEGNYFIEEDGLKSLEDNEQIAFRYCNSEGKITSESNVNGSVSSIAGITNGAGNVLGMMPHPERAMESILGSTDGVAFFESYLKS
jgi:phosphoribosylformylglycinamidine synthase